MLRIGVSLLLLSAYHAQVLFPGEVSNKGHTVDQSTMDDMLSSSLKINLQSFLNNVSSSSSTCFTPTGQRGTCGPLSQCEKYLPYLQQINNPVISRYFRQRICRLLLQSIHICCPFGDLSSPFGNNLPTIQPESPKTSIIPTEAECGLPGGVRITGGTGVQPGYWPWLTAIGQRTPQNTFFVNCGGTLITVRHVLTAAHCFSTGNDPDLVRLGEHHLENDFNGERPEEFRIASRRFHTYNGITHENDIAILVLNQDVIFNDFIRPACLPFKFRNEEFLGKSAFVVGWGRTKFEHRQSSKVPVEASVPFVPRNRCVSAYQLQRNKPSIDDRSLCAGLGVQDACNGDSGGPLNYLSLESGRYYLVGIVSFGVECGLANYPGVYTRVSSFLDWIQQNIQ